MQKDIMIGQPGSLEVKDELECIQGQRERLADACERAGEYLEKSVVRQKIYYDGRANEKPYELGDLVWTMHKSRKMGKSHEVGWDPKFSKG